LQGVMTEKLEHVVIGYDSRWPTIFKETAVWLRETRLQRLGVAC